MRSSQLICGLSASDSGDWSSAMVVLDEDVGAWLLFCGAREEWVGERVTLGLLARLALCGLWMLSVVPRPSADKALRLTDPKERVDDIGKGVGPG